MLTTQFALHLSLIQSRVSSLGNGTPHSCLGEGSTSQMCPQVNMAYTTPQRRLVMASLTKTAVSPLYLKALYNNLELHIALK